MRSPVVLLSSIPGTQPDEPPEPDIPPPPRPTPGTPQPGTPPGDPPQPGDPPPPRPKPDTPRPVDPQHDEELHRPHGLCVRQTLRQTAAVIRQTVGVDAVPQHNKALKPQTSICGIHVFDAQEEFEQCFLNLVDEEQADLIIMGTHGRTGVRRLLMGSVAEKIVRHANCPGLTLRNQHRLSRETCFT